VVLNCRKALDDTSKDKAKLQIEAEKFEKENRDLSKKLRDKESAFDRDRKDLKAAQAKLVQLQDELNHAQSELSNKAKLEKKLEDAKRNLEDETLKRIDLQNQLQTTKESMRFEQSMVEQQLNETKIRKQMEISEIDNRLTGQYEEKLQQSLSVSAHSWC
jgi:lamin B